MKASRIKEVKIGLGGVGTTLSGDVVESVSWEGEHHRAVITLKDGQVIRCFGVVGLAVVEQPSAIEMPDAPLIKPGG